MNEPQTFLDGRVELRPGDCMEVVKTLADNSIDSVVCDPPYALVSIVKRFGADGAAPCKAGSVYARSSGGFMGRRWDTGETAFAVEFWAEILRVLKPGGHVVAFGGTRTYHRLACAIEDAGFEIRDQLQWLYGSGFPKSHDVSKGIDKAAGAAREIVGDYAVTRDFKGIDLVGDASHSTRVNITAPATDAARQWSGWGTALKPSHEPIIWATKRFTIVPNDDILAEFSSVVEALLWSMSSANLAALRSPLSPPEHQGGAVSVRLLAELLDLMSSRGTFAMMDMFASQEAGSISLSIALLWNAILAASWPSMSTSTTGTKSSLTTGLKTLKSWILAIIPGDIIPDAISQNGLWLSVGGAGDNSSETPPLYKLTPTPSVVGSVSTSSTREILFALANIAVESSLLPLAMVESFVHQPAQIVSTTRAGEPENQSHALTVAEFLRLSQHEIRNIAGEHAWQSRTGSRLTPNSSPIVMARKPLSERTVAENVLHWSTGAINIDACRIESTAVDQAAMARVAGFNVSYSHGEPSISLEGGADGSLHRRDRSEFDATKGRWPANCCHNGSPEVLAAFPESDGQNGVVRGNEPSECHGGVYSGPHARQGIRYEPRGDSGSAARFFYSSKADSNDRIGSKHPTVKPVDLMQWLCKLVTPKGGIILDPFAGTGTTGEAAWREGFSCILIEREPEYQVDIARRMKYALSGEDERKHAIVVAKGQVQDAGPLFGGADTEYAPSKTVSGPTGLKHSNKPDGPTYRN